MLNDTGRNVDFLNSDITYQEVHDAVYRAKLRKAAGFDGISSEVFEKRHLYLIAI